jgi:hypothetical protein
MSGERRTPARFGAARRMAWPCLLALASCAHAAPPASQFPSAAQALEQLRATYRCATGVKGEAKIDQFSEAGRLRGKLLLFASRPDRLRFDVVSPPPFNSIVSTLTTDAGVFALADQRARKFYEGTASACNIARLTEVPIEAQALVMLLGGQAPLLVHRDAETKLEWNGHGYYVVQIAGSHGASEELHIAPAAADFSKPWQAQRLRVLDVRVAQQGIELYHAELGDHAWLSTAPPLVDPDGLDAPLGPSGPSCTVEVPRKLHIEVVESGQDVLFRYDEVKLNPPLPPGVFAQPVPDGMARERLDCSR